MKNLYWVITLKCNDFCDHCYNNSGPKGEVLGLDDLLQVVDNLPPSMEKITLSGGEVVTEMAKLLAIVKKLRDKFGADLFINAQTNGDLLNPKKLKDILDAGVDHISIASIDRYHKKKGEHADKLRDLFNSFDMIEKNDSPEKRSGAATFHVWGANEEIWLDGNWARGRAMDNNIALKDPKHNFCNMWSGGLGFLDEGSDNQEVHIQLYKLFPCCPTTYYALGDVRYDSVESILNKHKNDESYKALNKGQPSLLGLDTGLKQEFIQSRIDELGDVCLWCDEFFKEYYTGKKVLPRETQKELK